MPVVNIPDLKRKFALIRIYAHMSWKELGTAFGESHKNLEFWGNGSVSRDPDLLPDEKLAVLTDLVDQLLPPGTPAERVRHLVYGPAALLEEEIRTGVSAGMSKIIAAEGRHGQAQLIRRNDLALIEYDDRPDEAALPRLSPGEMFRIEFPVAHGCRYAVVLQNAQHSWAVLSSAVPDGGPVQVPPFADGDEAQFMYERRDLGRHLFVCMQSATPFSAALDAFRRDNATLDKRALDALAGAYERLRPAQRSCDVLTVSVEQDDGLASAG